MELTYRQKLVASYASAKQTKKPHYLLQVSKSNDIILKYPNIKMSSLSHYNVESYCPYMNVNFKLINILFRIPSHVLIWWLYVSTEVQNLPAVIYSTNFFQTRACVVHLMWSILIFCSRESKFTFLILMSVCKPTSQLMKCEFNNLPQCQKCKSIFICLYIKFVMQ